MQLLILFKITGTESQDPSCDRHSYLSYVTFGIVQKQCVYTTFICSRPQTAGLSRTPVLLPAARAEVGVSFEQLRKLRYV